MELLLDKGCSVVIYDNNTDVLSSAYHAIGGQQIGSLIMATSIFDLLQQDVSIVLVAVPEGDLQEVYPKLVQDAQQLGAQAIFCSNGFEALVTLTANLEPEERSKCCVLRFECSKDVCHADLSMLDGARKQLLLDTLLAAQLTLPDVADAVRQVKLDSVWPMSDVDLAQLVHVRMSKEMLARVIASSVALPALQILNLSGGQIDDATLASFCEWTERGCCPNLRQLNLSCNRITTTGMNAFARQLTHSAFARLTHLDLLFNHDDDGFDGLAKAVRGGQQQSIRARLIGLLRRSTGYRTEVSPAQACPPLAELRVLRVAMHSPSHALALEGAIHGGALPCLARLDMRHGKTLDIGGHLARAKKNILQMDGVHVTYRLW